MAKKMGIPLLSAPDQRIWHLTNGAGCQHFSFSQVQAEAAKFLVSVAESLGAPFLQAVPTPWMEAWQPEHMGVLTVPTADHLWSTGSTPRAANREERRLPLQSTGLENLPRRKAVHRGCQSSAQRNWPHLKQTFKPQGSLGEKKKKPNSSSIN